VTVLKPSQAAPAAAAAGTAGTVEPVAVSRETSAPEPSAAARAFFADALPAVVAYADLLAGDGVERGLIGPREVPRLWDRHLLNCAVVAELIPHGARVDDVGSGAGLPGIVLAIVRPDLQVTLVEPLLRRSLFLDETVATLGLGNVTVVRQRAEERAATQPDADVVVARAVAPLERLVGWCLPLLKPGGFLLALKGSSATDELREAGSAVRRLGGRNGYVVTVGSSVVDPATTLVRVQRDPAARTAAGKARAAGKAKAARHGAAQRTQKKGV
jgi:16S rRNA (guanine527-N7)-methyltransferase